MTYLLTYKKKSISVSHAKLWIQEMLAHLKINNIRRRPGQDPVGYIRLNNDVLLAVITWTMIIIILLIL